MTSKRRVLVLASCFGVLLLGVVYFLAMWTDTAEHDTPSAERNANVVRRPRETVAHDPDLRPASQSLSSLAAADSGLADDQAATPDADSAEPNDQSGRQAKTETTATVALTGIVVLRDGTPLPGHHVVQVSVLQSDSRTVTRRSTTATTDKGGHFMIPDAVPGISTLLVKGPGGGDVWGEQVDDPLTATPARVVRMAEELSLNFMCEVEPMHVRLVSVSHAGRRLLGVAMTDDGSPLQNELLYATNQEGEPVDVILTDSAGRFETVARWDLRDTVSLCCDGYLPVTIREITTDSDIGIVEFKKSEAADGCCAEALGF